MMPPVMVPLLISAGALVVGANALVVSNYLDVVEPEEGTVAADAATPAETAVAESPGSAAAQRIIGRILTKESKPRAPAEPGITDVLQFDCGDEGARSAMVGYQRPVTMAGKPMVAGVELWPTGYGTAAISDYRERAEACAADTGQVWVDSLTVAGHPAVYVGISTGGSTINTLRWSVGDVTLSLTGGDVPRDAGAIRAWTRRIEKLLKPVCTDLKPSEGDARRSPWLYPDDYQGLIEKTKVKVERPAIENPLPAKRKNLLELQTVDRPEAPQGVPIWPEKLPPKQTLPQKPERPERPAAKKKVAYQVPDPVGPGCGWGFTGTPAPSRSQEDTDADRGRLVAEATDELNAALAAWAPLENQWRMDIVSYYEAASTYRVYAAEVSDVAQAWEKTREEWARYYELVAARNNAIAYRAEWKIKYKQAIATWEANKCPRGTVAPPTPTPVPGQPAQPAPTLNCLLSVPTILTTTEPGIPPVPTRPADPRPKSAR